MRTLIALTALTLSLCSAGQAQTVRNLVSPRLSPVAAAQQTPIRLNPAVVNPAVVNLAVVNPAVAEPMNYVTNPYTGNPTTAGKWCRWFKVGVPALPTGGWFITNTTATLGGIPSVLHCRAASSTSQAVHQVALPVQDLLEAP